VVIHGKGDASTERGNVHDVKQRTEFWATPQVEVCKDGKLLSHLTRKD